MIDLTSEIDEIKKLVKENNLGEARIRCEKLVAQHPNNVEANFLMGMIYTSVKSFQRAEEHFEITLLLEPNYYDSLVQLSLLCERKGDRERAAIYRERSFRIAHQNI
jgi:tetratricopeptide (TPR) repeat protein